MIFQIPSRFDGNNYGERLVYESLQILFKGKKFFSLYSVGLSEHKTKEMGEADFVVLTDFGVFCLEVKSGPVERRADGIWQYGTYEKTEDPFTQANGAIYPIKKRLREIDKQRANKFLFGSGVIFTDFEFQESGVEWNSAQICGQNKFKYGFERFLKDLGTYHRKRLRETKGVTLSDPITYSDLEWVLKAIRPEISHVSLVELETSKSEIIRLEEKQAIYLEQIIESSKNSKTIIDGAAGTGKTIIIKEAIQRLPITAQILLVCYNDQLARYFSSLLSKKPNIKVYSIHRLMRFICQKAKVEINQKKPTLSNEKSKFFNEFMPEKFEEALVKLSDDSRLDEFDWIMVDEAQDFLNKRMYDNLMFLSRGKETGNALIAVDSGVQSELYENLDYAFLEKIKEQFLSLKFEKNYRNPPALAFRAAAAVGLSKPSTARTFVTMPKLHSIDSQTNDPFQKLETIVKNYIDKGVKPIEISILTFKARDKSILSKKTKIAGKFLFDLKTGDYWGGNNKDTIQWSTIPSFKGLENEYIILLEGENQIQSSWALSLLYVAITRAKTEFNYIGEPNHEIWRSIKNERD